MDSKRVLITGAGGMLGADVYRTFSEEYGSVLATDIDQNEEWLEYLDVRDAEACNNLCESYKPDLILHLAALTDLEYCENEKDDAWSTWVATENAAAGFTTFANSSVVIDSQNHPIIFFVDTLTSNTAIALKSIDGGKAYFSEDGSHNTDTINDNNIRARWSFLNFHFPTELDYTLSDPSVNDVYYNKLSQTGKKIYVSGTDGEAV